MNSRQMVESSGDAARRVLLVISDVRRDPRGKAVESCLVKSAVARGLSKRKLHLKCRDAVKTTE